MTTFAVWRAVSSLEQVGGASLDHQLKECRRRANSEHWQDTGLVFTADGYSRTGYVDLSFAEKEIPPLGECLDAMRSGQYDLLVTFNYDRFGDILIPILTEFRNHGKQIYSVSQPTDIRANYDKYADDSSFIVQTLGVIWQKQRISDMQRKWRAGMPRRLEEGLTPLSTPFGYKWMGRKEVPEPVPSQLNLVQQMYDWLMLGLSLSEIKRRADATGILSPRGKSWDTTTIRKILANPYYSGQVALYKSRTVYDASRQSRTRQVPQPQSKWLIKQGKHKALFSTDQYKRAVLELDRRRVLAIHSAMRFPLSGLVYCAKCGRKMYRNSHKNAKVGHRTYILKCNKDGHSHVIWEYDEAVPAIAQAIQDVCKDLDYDVPEEPVHDTDAVLDDLHKRRQRIQQSAELGVFSPAEAAQKIAALEVQMEKTKARQEGERDRLATRAQFMEQMGEQLDYLSEWVMHDDPQLVNRLLSSLVKRLVIHPSKSVTVELR